jgi:hypothetical protein
MSDCTAGWAKPQTGQKQAGTQSPESSVILTLGRAIEAFRHGAFQTRWDHRDGA